jgi:CRP-like cAMP-binding protein
MISLELLNSIQLFRDLPLELTEEIRQQVRMREFRRREFVLHRGGQADALLMLFTGRLQVIASSESGKEVGINIIEPSDCFGEIALIDGGTRSASVIAMTNSMVGFLPKAEALWLFRNNPLVAERIQRRLCATIRKEIHYRSSLGGSKAFTRIYALLLEGQKAIATGTQTALEDLPTQQSLASMANVSRETVSRAIGALAKAGVIRKDARRIVVIEPALLTRLAQGEVGVTDLPTEPVPRPRQPSAAPSTTTVVIRRAPQTSGAID